jgi:Caspase domain
MRLRLCAFALLVPVLTCTAQTKRALLIGINLYEPAGTTAQHPAGCAYGRCELGSFDNLDGAVNDAQAMADLLASPKFGFPADNVVLLTNPAPPQPRPGVVVLPAAQTDRDGILAAMQKYLVDVPQKGDTVVFYDASHGSLRVNTKGTKMTVLLDGKYVHADSTLVPADAYKGGFDVRDREMTHIFNAALDKGIHLTVIFDSCHSGGATRGVSKSRPRTLPYDPRDIAEAPDTLPDGHLRPAPSERTDNPALVFSAAQQDQEANEADPSSAMPESHGAFTAALVEALQVLPTDAPASVVYQRVKAVLEGSSAASQNPDLDATAARRQQPLFGGTSASDTGKVRAAVLKSDTNGIIWLDAGRVSGIGVGSEFTSMNKSGDSILLRVTELQGIARTTAKVISPAGAKVAPGEVFELAKWVPTESAPLRFWLSPSNLSQADILAAAAQVKSSGVTSVADPAEEPWTDILSWDGTHWTLQRAKSPAVVLGAKLTTADLKQHLAADAKLWVNLPPSRELAAKLALHDNNSAVQIAPNVADANYILTATLTGDTPAYAWFHKQEFDAGPRAKSTADHTSGCSATSQYPVRSDWVPLADAKAIDDGASSLNKYASLLAKVHGWLQLAETPTGASTARYYKLAMIHATDQTPLPSEQAAQQDDRLQLILQSATQVTERRWVYVLDIDCHGKGVLLYPRNYAENQFPSEADAARQFVLPGAPTLRIGPPYGIDTLVMLSTEQPLPDPYALEFEGVATRGGGGPDSPLGRLLTDTSRGTRGAPGEVPTNWGIDLTTLRSVPKDAPK